MKKIVIHSASILLLLVAISGCSTKKNTWASRTYQAVHTRFNVHFNGAISYNDGLENITKANQDNFSTIIPMYPISIHTNATSATANMDRTIEKSRKAIKLHSIKKKPAKNHKKANSPEYMRYYNQNEFNSELKKAWLMLAQAEFHKADFLGASATFAYIARQYATDKDMVITCQLWIARSYGEMDWKNEAQQIIQKLNQNDLRGDNTGLFASVNADLLLKNKQYKEAIPFLELALSKEKNKTMKVRFAYLLAQLYQKNGNSKQSFDSYTNVIKSNPPYTMGFNARIARAQLNQGDVEKVRKELKRMLKNSNNKEFLDQIYFAIGNTYLNHADTVKAIENYNLSIKNSTRNGVDKATTLITLGDLYYYKKNYVPAQPCYDEASKIITKEHDDFNRVTKLSETLGELVVQNNIVVLQDSLQELSKLSEADQLAVVNNIIKKINDDEREAAEQAQDKRREDEQQREDFANLPPIGAGVSAEWYFYNPALMRNGQLEFQKRWGKRKLEDNWRRINKASSAFDEESLAVAEEKGDSSTVKTNLDLAVTDIKKPEFYLKQIPVTPAQIEKSNSEIGTALYNMGLIYLEKIEDYPLAVATFERFFLRFPQDERIPNAYFQLYLTATKADNNSEAQLYKDKLIQNYPDSKQAKILTQSNSGFFLSGMNSEPDSIYNITYTAYLKSDYNTVFEQVGIVQKKYPLTSLMPKFLLLNALSIGKKDKSEKFETALTELVEKYPTSDVSSMAKDMLALLKQGQKATNGTSSGTLLSRREEQVKEEISTLEAANGFSPDKRSKHRLLLICKATQDGLNKLQYRIASFNFSRFMIKDFDLVINRKDSLNGTLSVTNFESYDEVESYIGSLSSDGSLIQALNDAEAQKIIISDDNYAIVKANGNWDEYFAFETKIKEKGLKPTPSVATKQVKKQEQLATQKNKSNNAKEQLSTQKDLALKSVEKTKEVAKQTTVVKKEQAVEPTPKQTETKPEQNKISTEQVAVVIQEESSSQKEAEKTATSTVENKNQEKQIAQNSGNSPEKTKKSANLPSMGMNGKLTPTVQTENKNNVRVTEKASVAVSSDKLTTSSAPVTQKIEPKTSVQTIPVQPKEPEVPLFKNLFGYRANEAHFVAIYIVSGTYNFEAVKSAIDAYNKQNFASMNLVVTQETINKQNMILVGSMPDGASAKSYLMRMVKEKGLFNELKGADYRNLVGSHKNLNVLMQQNALNVYFEFMKEYYLK